MIMVWIYNQLKLKEMVPYGMHGMAQIQLLVVFPIVVLEPIQAVVYVHQVEFAVVEEQQQ